MLKLSTLSALRSRGYHCVAVVTSRNTKKHIYTSRQLCSELNPMKHILKENNIPEADKKQIEKEVKEITKDWVSYGYHETDKEEDIFLNRAASFFFLTVALFPSLFFWYYSPGQSHHDWSWREAFLELERRQRDGLPLVDKDLIPASQVQLPGDDELDSDVEIII
ncbi:unnamed protein product [Heterobilharzia americana]|nr:unnamed protein product [Heterobilharzia americana]